MATAVVYCTANLSADHVNDFLRTSKAHKEADGGNWSLARTPEPATEETTSPPVSFFETGYHNWTAEQLQQHHAQRLPRTQGFLSPSMFAVLDKRSAHDRTVVIHTLEVTWPQEQIETGDPDPEKAIEKWKEFRVKFEVAAAVVAVLAFDSSTITDALGEEEKFDEDGVFKFDV